MPDLEAAPVYFASRPTLTLDERAVPELSDGLLSALVEEDVEGLYRCECTFGNWGSIDGGVGFLYQDRDLLDFGKRLSLRGGAESLEGELFAGRITAIEGQYPRKRPPEVVVLAEDRFQDLRMTRRNRSFEDVSDQDVIQQIASDHGMQSEVDVEGPTYSLLAQVNQSDLAFLRDRARRVDAEIWIDGNTLHAQARGRRQSESLALTYGQGLAEFSVLADVASQRTSLTINGWDVGAKAALEHEADSAAMQAELGGRAGGGSILQEAFGARAERLVHCVPLSGEEARSLAEAHYRRMARRFVTGRGVAPGDARIRVGATVELLGLGRLFDGEYYVCEVRHGFDSQEGLRTWFTVERPALGTG